MSCQQVTVSYAINIIKGYVVLKMDCEFIALRRESSLAASWGAEAVIKLVLLLG